MTAPAADGPPEVYEAVIVDQRQGYSAASGARQFSAYEAYDEVHYFQRLEPRRLAPIQREAFQERCSHWQHRAAGAFDLNLWRGLALKLPILSRVTAGKKFEPMWPAELLKRAEATGTTDKL